jgi:hypothetical protein
MAGTVITQDDMLDFLLGTQPEYIKSRFDIIAPLSQTYPVARSFFGEKKKMHGPGKGVTWFMLSSLPSTAQNIGYNTVAVPVIRNYMTSAHVDFAFMRQGLAYHIRDIADNMGSDVQLFDLMMKERVAKYTNMMDKLETDAWSDPNPSDKTMPMTIPAWVPKAGTNSTGETFTGILHPAYTAAGIETIADLNPTTNPGHRSYNRVYQAIDLISATGLGKSLSRFMDDTAWESPYEYEELTPKARALGFYCGQETFYEVQDIFVLHRDAVTKDLGVPDGTPTHRGVPFHIARKLDSDDDRPIYCLDFSVGGVGIKEDFDFAETAFKPWEDIPEMFVAWIWLMYQFYWTNRRRLGVIHKNVSGLA